MTTMTKKVKPIVLAIITAILVSGTVFFPATIVRADSPITIDGQFADWEGQVNITDPTDDAYDAGGNYVDRADITAFYWTNNPNEEACYWMIERLPSDRLVRYLVYFDANNNGIFNEHVDRLIFVQYNPLNNNSRVRLSVRCADNGQKIFSDNSNNDWGESARDGGRRVEFSISFAHLGMTIGKTIRMYVISYTKGIGEGQDDQDDDRFDDEWATPFPVDRVPDTGDVQWSPVPIMGYWFIGLTMAGVGIYWYVREKRKWQPRR